jgi:GAF domain-containing protein/HAMP domain-containing protein
VKLRKETMSEQEPIGERETSEAPRTILAARVTSTRARLIGSLLIVLALLALAAILYAITLARMERAVLSLQAEVLRTEALTEARQTALFAEIEEARRAMRLVPAVWGGLVGVAAVIASFITIRSIARPVERLTAAAERLATGRLDERVRIEWSDEFGRLGAAFNEMADRLQAIYTELEQRVAERTAALERRVIELEAAAEVARDAAAIRNVNELLDETVRLISDRFGFYHAGLFLLDDVGEYAVLQAASSEGGQRMLARRHRLRVGEVGIVGYVAGSGEPRVALDVGEDAVFFDNPDLPQTRSEMTLPLRVRDEVIGVLDVQSREPHAFTDEDVAVLQTMADQLALAIQNAHLMDNLGRTVRELEIAQGRYVEEAWRAVAQGAGQVPGYRYRHAGLEPVAERPLEAVRAWQEGRPVITTDADTGDGRESLAALAVPMKLRGQVVGALNLRFEGESLSSETVETVEEIADRLALALENARLLEETQRRAARDRLVTEVSSRIRETLDLEAVLRTAASEMRQALNLDDVVIRLADSGTDGGSGAGSALQRKGTDDVDQD